MSHEVVLATFSWSGSHVDGYVVHIDGDVPFIDEVTEYCIHHGLEGCWRVHQTEEHDCWFI